MSLDHPDFCRVHASIPVAGSQQISLRAAAGRNQTIGLAVAVDGGPLDGGEDNIAYADRIGQTFQHDHAHTFTRNKAVRTGIETVAFAGGRQHARTVGGQIKPRRNLQEYPACDRHIHLTL
ncbi:hypothetical protein RvVAR0630_43450 [Agrobacterium vitis]|nr:hypothetical protein RvVAR0630_43450 [Agrobacterium vitis]